MPRYSKDMPPEERQKLVDHAKANLADPVIREKMFGPAAREKRRQTIAKKKEFKKLAKMMLETDLPQNDDVRAALAEAGFDQYDYQSGVLLAQLRKALVGDTEAAKFVRDSSGQKPTDSLQVGNLDDVPVTELDLSQLSTEELKARIAEIEAGE